MYKSLEIIEPEEITFDNKDKENDQLISSKFEPPSRSMITMLGRAVRSASIRYTSLLGTDSRNGSSIDF